MSFSSEAKTTTTTAAWRFTPRTTPACVVCLAAGDGRGRNPTPVSAAAAAVYILSPLVLGADLLRVPQPLPASPALPARTPIYESVIRERYALLVHRPLPSPLSAIYHPCMHAHLHTSSRCAVQCACLPIIRCFHPSPCRGLPRSLARSLSYLNYRSIALRFAAAD